MVAVETNGCANYAVRCVNGFGLVVWCAVVEEWDGTIFVMDAKLLSVVEGDSRIVETCVRVFDG